MSDRQVRVVISAVDKGAGGKLTEVGDKGQKAGHRIADGFSKVGQLIGGEVGNAIQEASDKLEHFGKGNRIAATGAAFGALGGVLTAMGSKEQQATQQLDNAIKNSGHSVDEYGKRIDDTVHHMEKFGHSAVDTKQSLQTLTNATHDPAKALDLMGEAADLAASKHISLQTAATQLAKVIGGHGAKTLAAYNLQVVKNADGTANWAATNEKLAQVLSGQASAASDTFTGRLKALRTEVEDNVATFGQKYGPAILIAGTMTSTLGPMMAKGVSALKGMRVATATTAAATEASAGSIAAAEGTIAASTTATAAAVVRADETMIVANRSVLGSVGKLGIGMGVMATVALAASASMPDQIPIMKEITKQYDFQTHSTDHSAKAMLAWMSTAGDMDQLNVGGMLKSTKLSSDDLAKGVSGTDAEFKTFMGTLKDSGHVSGDQSDALNLLHKQFRNTSEAVAAASTAVTTLTSADAALVGELGTTGGALTQLSAAHDQTTHAARMATLQMQYENDAAGLLSDALNKLNDKTLNAEEANMAFKDSVHALNQSEKDNGHTLSDNSVKGRANLDVVFSAIKAAQAHAEAVGKQTGSVTKATATFNADKAALRQHMIALGFNKDAVDKLIGTYGKMPTVKLTRAELQDQAARAKIKALTDKINAIKQGHVPGLNANTQAGRYAVQELQWEIDRLQGKNITIGISTFHKDYFSLSGTGKKGNASGTEFFSGGMTDIAEREPEAVYLPRGTRITPLSRMRGSGGAVQHFYDIKVTVPVGTNMHEAGRALAGALEQYAGAGGKIRIKAAVN